MGNCNECNCTNLGEQRPAAVLTKQDRIDAFEKSLPFASLFIDDYEQLVMAVAKLRKINGIY